MLSWFKDIYRLDVYSLDASWVCSCSLNGSGWHMVESTLIVTNNCHSSFIDIYRVSFVVFYPSQKKWTPLHQTAGVFQPHQTADLLIVAEITGSGGVRKDHFLSKELDVRQSLIDLLNTSQIAALSCKLCKLWQLTFIFEQRLTKLGYIFLGVMKNRKIGCW